MSGDKRRWPRTEALAVASDLLEALNDVTERITIAGSIRRRKPTVGDVELLFIPTIADRRIPGDLFACTEPVDLAGERLEAMLTAGILAKRLNVEGRPTWGIRNKLAVHVATGIPVDLFATTASSWWNYLVCRTGPAESNTEIATRAQARGWKWQPYGAGFLTPAGVHQVTSEADVFHAVGLAYRAPDER